LQPSDRSGSLSEGHSKAPALSRRKEGRCSRRDRNRDEGGQQGPPF
jgi:hypothetical protein